ncbi:TlyA family RNA methyltransferase [Alsobacter sp. SYSU M60028]|uniref:TlyA family RNA methyltransferase n=1 Tax=Alsobacter ponti TaxID=2962936 RepID=A0ABT1LC16_9HYPH|nr:TlyA family RNA methyltransferase [Alsobacter ponti]MCP8939047.1 TlyA family RNA methyltransferase [Alsobacter ponti]
MSTERADLALVRRGLFESRAKAQEAIAAGLVSVDGVAVRKPSEPVADDAAMEARPAYPWVSRGGLKLAAALDEFGYDPAGRQCLDIGASTGGFCHVLLARGAARVLAVDVGHGQLHRSLAGEPRLVSMEGRDARSLTAAELGAPPSLVTFDVSFIPLGFVLPHVLALAAPDAALCALVKPQFEAGRGQVRKGIVRDEAVRRAACERVARQVEEQGWRVDGVIVSPIAGGDGNIEYLIGARRGAFPAAPREHAS